jgi:hypothetical protein
MRPLSFIVGILFTLTMVQAEQTHQGIVDVTNISTDLSLLLQDVSAKCRQVIEEEHPIERCLYGFYSIDPQHANQTHLSEICQTPIDQKRHRCYVDQINMAIDKYESACKDELEKKEPIVALLYQVWFAVPSLNVIECTQHQDEYCILQQSIPKHQKECSLCDIATLKAAAQVDFKREMLVPSDTLPLRISVEDFLKRLGERCTINFDALKKRLQYFISHNLNINVN